MPQNDIKEKLRSPQEGGGNLGLLTLCINTRNPMGEPFGEYKEQERKTQKAVLFITQYREMLRDVK